MMRLFERLVAWCRSWRAPSAAAPVVAVEEPTLSSVVACPNCGCVYDLEALGLRDHHGQATLVCGECGTSLELHPHAKYRWRSPAMHVRGDGHVRRVRVA